MVGVHGHVFDLAHDAACPLPRSEPQGIVLTVSQDCKPCQETVMLECQGFPINTRPIRGFRVVDFVFRLPKEFFDHGFRQLRQISEACL